MSKGKILGLVVGAIGLLCIGFLAGFFVTRNDTKEMDVAVATKSPVIPTDAPTIEPTTVPTEEPVEENQHYSNAKVMECLDVKMVHASVSASSTLSKNHDVSKLSDNNPATCWAEGVDADGVSESITLTNSESEVSGVAILPGNMANESDYKDNGRPMKVDVNVDGTVYTYDLGSYEPDFQDPKEGMLYLSFNEDCFVKKCTVKIVGAAGGGKHQDTCISELYLYQN